MNYSELSDFEINKLVAEKLGYRVKEDFQWEKEQCWVKVDKENEHSKIFDYCGDANDAWVIITKNEIDLIHNGLGCTIATDNAVDLIEKKDAIFHQDENPLRAAMIVFLMMQENKND